MHKKLLIVIFALAMLFSAAAFSTGAVEALPEGSGAWVDTNANGVYDSGVDVACDTYVEAMKAVSADGQTVYLVKDCDFSAAVADTKLPYSYTLDLGGHTLRGTKYILIADTDKTVTLKNGTIYGSYKNASSSHAVSVQAGATLILDHVKLYNGGTFDETAYPGRTAIAVGASTTPNGSANVIIKNDSFVYTAGGGSPAYAIGALYGSVNITIEDSHVKTDHTGYAIYAATVGTIAMDTESSVSCASADRFFNSKCSLTKLTGYDAIKVYNSQNQSYMLTMEPVTQEGIAVTVTASSGGSAYLDGGESSVTVQEGTAVTLTVTPDEGWYVESVYAGQAALDVAEAGGTVTWTPSQRIEPVAVNFVRYALKYESADKTMVRYANTVKEALGMVIAEGDTITLCKDVAMGTGDYMGNTYRIEINCGFTLDLAGHVLSSDRSIMRLMNSDTETEATVTIRNGMLISAQETTSRHMLTLSNKGSLVLENVQAYCGAYYIDGQIVVNDDEVANTNDGVNAVIMCSGEGTVTVKDSTLCTYGNFNVINTNNTNQELDQTRFFLENAKLITYSKQYVFGCADKRAYTVQLLDANTELLTHVSANGAGNSYVQFIPCDGYNLAGTGTVDVDGTTFYRYGLVPVCTVTWKNYDGTVLETQNNVPIGTVPAYTGQTPTRPADQANVYAFAGWTPAVSAVTGQTAYTATYIALPADYQQVTLDMITQTGLYKTQGRTYLTQQGVNLDYAGSSVEFTAACGGTILMTYTAQTEVYYQVFIDGQAKDRVYAAEGENVTVRLEIGLTGGKHTVRIVRDSDITTQGQSVAISSITFTGKADTLEAPADRDLYIEFIGDSITAGKYTAMEYGSGVGIHKATNSYAFLTAEAMGADYSLVARGGCGYFRVSSCPQPIHKLYPYYNGFHAEPVLYTPTRQADVVVLALGTNDTAADILESYENGTVPFETFQAAVEHMIGQIRLMHGQDVKIVLLHNMMTGSWEAELRAAALAQDVYYLKVTQDRNGGNNHPSARGHQVIAQELTAFLNDTVLANVSVCDGEQTVNYRTLQAAADALQEGQYIRLNTDIAEDVIITGNVYLDLNGHTLTGSFIGTGKLYGMDCATDGYTTDTMGRITGTVSCDVAGNFKTDVTGAIRRYMAIADEEGYTFHRFHLGLTHMSLKPANTGLGYKAVFCGDEQVRSQIAGYGYTLWVGENGKQVSAGKEEAFVSGKTVTLRLQNFDVAGYGEEQVYGKVYLKLKNGGTVESAAYSCTLRQLVESVAANIGQYDQTQLVALQAMLAKFEQATKDWDIDSIRNYQ